MRVSGRVGRCSRRLLVAYALACKPGPCPCNLAENGVHEGAPLLCGRAHMAGASTIKETNAVRYDFMVPGVAIHLASGHVGSGFGVFPPPKKKPRTYRMNR